TLCAISIIAKACPPRPSARTSSRASRSRKRIKTQFIHEGHEGREGNRETSRKAGTQEKSRTNFLPSCIPHSLHFSVFPIRDLRVLRGLICISIFTQISFFFLTYLARAGCFRSIRATT